MHPLRRRQLEAASKAAEQAKLAEEKGQSLIQKAKKKAKKSWRKDK